jgi:hypothetical protein
MGRRLYNLRLLGDGKQRDSAFAAFVEGYASSLDVFPYCARLPAKRTVDQLWEDFVTVSGDVNRSVHARLGGRTRDDK